MGFYGKVNNKNATQFVIDKIYSSRVEMEGALTKGDGVFIGRYVLVDYGKESLPRLYKIIEDGVEKFYFSRNLDDRAKFLTEEDYNNKYNNNSYLIENYLREGDVIFILDEELNQEYYICTGGDKEGFAEFASYDIAPQSESYFANYREDVKEYGDSRGFDSTVWQKIYVDEAEKYVMIAELNSVVPTFDLTIDAPTEEPRIPHFDEDSTNVYYRLHVQPNWGFRVKPDSGVYSTNGEAIYYNADGFKVNKRSHVNKVDEISLKPSGISTYSKNIGYNAHDTNNPFATIKDVKDIQELSIILPSIGNAISDMWDLLYGVVKLDENGKPLKDENDNYIYEEDRKLDVAWDEIKGLRQVNEGETGYLLNSWETETVAGCINSVHDLMGMIIQDDPNVKVENALTNKIYYGNLENKFVDGKPYYGFYIKDLGYIYNKDEIPTPVKIDKIIDFEKNKYYYFTNNNYYLEENEYNSGNSYYDLTGKISAPMTLIDGYKSGVYFYQENNNYILEHSDNPDENKIYYTIDPALMTIMSAPYKEGDKSVKLFFIPKDYITDEATGIKKGYFYLDEDDNVYRPITKDSKFSVEDFNTLDFYWVENFTIEKKPNAENPNVDSLVYIVEPEDIKYSVDFILFDSNKNYYYIDDLGNYLYLNGEENIDQSIIYYIFEDKSIEEVKNPFYEPNTYYYLSGGKNYIFAIDKEKPVNDFYYKLNDIEIADTVFYEPNKYWYKKGQSYVIDTNLTVTKNREYYNYSDLYVIEDSNGIFSKGSVWNSSIDPKKAPEGVVLGTRAENWQWKELKGFARNLNTIHGLIIEINNILKVDDKLTRDQKTVQGCINTINDLIDKIDTLIPAHFIIVDEYGRMKSSPYTSEQKYVHKSLGIIDTEKQNRSQGESENRWIELSIDDSYDNPMVTIRHSFLGEAPTETWSDKNGAKITENLLEGINNNTDDTLKLYTPIVDNMGHVVGQNTETVTLPYGFKTISTNGRGQSEDENATSIPDTADIVADSAQDVLTINSGNKWVRIDSDSDNDIITISHDIHEVDGAAADSTDLNDGTDTITIQDINFDVAGHVISNKNHTYTLPFGYKSFKDSEENPSQTDAETTQSIMTLIGDNWIKPSVSAQDTLKYEHIGPVESNEVKSEDADKAPAFGETFEIEDWYFDDKGHKSNRLTHTIKIPIGSLEDTTSVKAANVLTSIDFTPSTGAIKTTHENLSQLTLTGYEKINNNADVSAEDTLSTALSKLQTQIIEEEEARVAAINGENGTRANEIKRIDDALNLLNGDISTNRIDIEKLNNLVGAETVQTQINNSLIIDGDEKYALATAFTELTDTVNATTEKVEILEAAVPAEKIAKWDAAEANVQSDWNENDNTSDAFIKNKPDLSQYVSIEAYNNLLNQIEILEGRIKALEDLNTSPIES